MQGKNYNILPFSLFLGQFWQILHFFGMEHVARILGIKDGHGKRLIFPLEGIQPMVRFHHTDCNRIEAFILGD